MHSWTHHELSLVGLPGADGGAQCLRGFVCVGVWIVVGTWPPRAGWEGVRQGQQLWAALPTRSREALVISG